MYYKYSLLTLIYLTRVQLKITTQSKLNVLQRFCSAVLLFGFTELVRVKKLEIS